LIDDEFLAYCGRPTDRGFAQPEVLGGGPKNLDNMLGFWQETTTAGV
jgi:hypothetical protein